jgi:hypothetical protein
MAKYIISLCLILGLLFLIVRSKNEFFKREIPKKVNLVVRIIGCCILMLSIWGLSMGSIAPATFAAISLLGIVVGYKLHIWIEHVSGKCENEYPTEKDGQKLMKFISMGKWKFIFFNGALLYGLIGVIGTSITAIWNGFDLWAFIIFIIFLMIIGILSGIIQWNCIQDIYQKYYLHENVPDDN